jgi:futalosine hydrolase
VNILIVSATELELAPFAAALRAHQRHHVDILTTGVGMVATAAWCARTLGERRADVALNLGVCGSFDPALSPGTVVHVVADRFPELGAEDGDAFLSIEDLGLIRTDPLKLEGPTVINANPPVSSVLAGLPTATGMTVNTVHGNERSIAAVLERVGPNHPHGPLVESMEGAAFMYACLMQGVPFAQVRAVSNRVERRARAAWKMDEAIGNLGKAALGILDTLEERR